METKVVKVISDTTVVLGAGSKQGVKEGMEFVIYEVGDPVYDPETTESLGNLEIPKGRVEVFHVQDCLAIARTFKHTVKRTVGGVGFEALFPLARTVEVDVYQKLNVDQADESYNRRLKVKVGDRARQVQA